MLRKIHQLYSLETYENEEERRVARLQLTFILIHWAIAALLLLLDMVWQDALLAIVIGMSVAAQFISLWLLFKGRRDPSADLSILIYILGATSVGTMGGGIHDLSIMVYPIVIMVAGVIGQVRGLWIAAATSSLALVWLVVGESFGLVARDYIYVGNSVDLLIGSALLLVATFVAFRLVGNAQNGLLQSWHELAQRRKVEADLRDALAREQFLVDVIHNSTIPIGVGGPDGTIKLVNRVAVEQIGYSEEELKTLSWKTNLTPPEWWEIENERLIQLHQTKKSVRYEKEFIRKDGTRFPAELIVHPHLDENGNIDAYFSFITDITERKEMEDMLRFSEERYRLLADDSPLAIGVTDLETGRIVYANQQSCELLKTTPEKLLGSLTSDLYVNPDKRDALIKKILADRSINDYEVQMWKANGEQFWASVTATLSLYDNRPAIHSHILDITPRKAAEDALKEMNRRLSLAFEVAGAGAWEWNLITNQTYWSEEYYQLLQYEPHSVEARLENLLARVHPDDRAYAEQEISASLAGNCGFDIQMRLLLPDLSVRWVRNVSKAIEDEHGRPLKLVGVQLDVTESKMLELQLEESEISYRSIIESAQIGISVRQNEKSVLNNSRVLELTGYSESEALNMDDASMLAIVHPEDRVRVMQMYADRLAGRRDATRDQYRLLRKNGDVLWVDAIAQTISYKGKSAQLGLYMDITTQKQAEDALRASEHKWRSLVQILPEYVALYDSDGRYTFLNHYAEGFSEEDVIGGSFRDFMPEPSYQPFIDAFEKACQQGVTTYLEYDGFGDRGNLRRYDSYFVPIHQDGRPVNIMVIARDITERKQAENQLRESEDRYRQAISAADAIPYTFDYSINDYIYMGDGIEKLTGNSGGRDPFKNVKHITSVMRGRFKGMPLIEAINLMRAGTAGQMWTCDHLIELHNGVRRWYSDSAIQYNDEQGRPKGSIGILQDITERKQMEEDLRAGEARYRAIVEDQTELICRFKPDGTLTYVNEIYCQYMGKRREELIGHGFAPLVPEEDQMNLEEHFSLLTLSNPIMTIEYRVILPDGSVHWQQWTHRAIFDSFGEIQEYAAVGRDTTELKTLQEQERDYAAVQERQRLARDLHDAVSQTLFSARLTSEMLLRQHDTVPSHLLWRSISHFDDLVKSALGEMRIMLLELRPEGLVDTQLSSLLTHLVDAAHGRIEAQVSLQINDRFEPPQNVKIAFYRIAQEALNNIIKHSSCTEVKISLNCQPAMIELSVQDNGQGFTAQTGQGKHLGITIMGVRASEIGAEFEISSQEDSGTFVKCNWRPQEVLHE